VLGAIEFTSSFQGNITKITKWNVYLTSEVPFLRLENNRFPGVPCLPAGRKNAALDVQAFIYLNKERNDSRLIVRANLRWPATRSKSTC